MQKIIRTKKVARSFMNRSGSLDANNFLKGSNYPIEYNIKTIHIGRTLQPCLSEKVQNYHCLPQNMRKSEHFEQNVES